jgi:tyrocidine synthetase-3
VLVQENGDGRELVAYVTGPVDAAELRDELKPKLPGYMMPAHLIVLDSFPLNANGKIDRKALPRPSVAAARGRLSLESETERTLAEIWKEVLGAPEVGATDDFFDIGGHSLKVTKVVAAIQRRLGMTVPIAAVFRRSTVRELARYLLDNAEFGVPRADGAMVCLGGPENGVQLFALPPGTGDVFSYMPFPALLPRYRLNAFNFIEAESRFCDYADLVGLAQPHGPCILLGYSGGGNLAFHVAAELERRGRQVSDIIMIDSGRILSPYPYLHDVVMRIATEFLADETIAPYCATPVLRDKVIRRIVGVHRLFAEMTDDQIIDANIHVVLANPPMLEARFEDRVISSVAAWKDATRGTFRTYAGEGNHAVMLTQPALAQNAAAIQSILARVAALAPSLPPRLLTGPERASTGVRPSS